MNWAEVPPCQGDVLKATSLSWRQADLTDLAESLPIRSSKNQAGLDANTVVPAADLQPAHQFRIVKASVRQQANLMEPEKVEETLDLSEDGKEMGRTDLGTGMFKDM
nr:hypothetical protein [Deinococcus aquatilis]